MKVLITGADGFVGKNLQLHLAQRKGVQVALFTRNNTVAELPQMLQDVDFVFHLAGVNRPSDPAEFIQGNVDVTRALCATTSAIVVTTGKRIPIVYTSSIQAAGDSLYGVSKRGAEVALLELAESHSLQVHIFRLPNVFGKWCKPNYNSAVATFCHNIARDLPIQVNDPNAVVKLVYVDDLIARFIELLDGAEAATDKDGFALLCPQYTMPVGELAQKIRDFRQSRSSLMTDRVGTGFARALYLTYVSYLPVASFSYRVPSYSDPRGVFVEMLKTPDAGQFSYFTAHPGVTRGGHYHHSKTEKFLVIKGQARFKFRQMQSGETHELLVSGDGVEIVETVPGWTHDITNVGSDELIVMLWANEVFDKAHPDTINSPV